MSCRPEPEEADLATTATTIWHAAHSTAPDAAQERILSSVAAAYYQHYCTQSRPDFHGLRDFYAVISTLRLQPQLSPAQLYKALLRNFGGPAEQVQQVRDGVCQWGRVRQHFYLVCVIDRYDMNRCQQKAFCSRIHGSVCGLPIKNAESACTW